MSKPRVFVPQMPQRKVEGEWVQQFDLKPAEHFGDIVILQQAHTAAMFFPVPTIREIKDRLRDFGERDYILAIGDPSLMVTTALVAGQHTGGRVKLLKWDRLQRCYIAVQIDVTGRST